MYDQKNEGGLFTGDCRLILPELATSGVKAQTCITSPPYYGLRDYGCAGQIGLETTPRKPRRCTMICVAAGLFSFINGEWFRQTALLLSF